jgi:hypothetical protein
LSRRRATWLLAICVLGAGACSDGPGARRAESDSAELAALEQRIAAATALSDRLKAVRAVKHLQHAYGHYSEVGLWHDFADLFSDTAVGHYTQGDLGKEEIRKLFVEQVGQGILGLADGRIYPHIALSPVITLAADGRSAKARWRIVAMLGGYGGSASFARRLRERVPRGKRRLEGAGDFVLQSSGRTLRRKLASDRQWATRCAIERISLRAR